MTERMVFASVRFMSVCPKCRGARTQDGFSTRTLLRLLDGNHPIEAYCLYCDLFWPISAEERLTLAFRLHVEISVPDAQ
jgi:hypothetical protein